MNRILIGCISYCPSDPEKKKARIEMHQKQLRWLESFLPSHDYKFYRIEQAYDEEFENAAKSDILRIDSIKFDYPMGPSAARNVLLKFLYESDNDWLICMDDDRLLYDHYAANNFITEIEDNPHMKGLASTGVLITGVCPAMRPFKKYNAEFDDKLPISDFWNLIKCPLNGFLQICCIPNLVKYDKKPVFFDENLTLEKLRGGSMQEDVKFEIDWVKNKGQVALNLMFIIKDILDQTHPVSTVYEGKANREEMEGKGKQETIAYIKMISRNRYSNVPDYNKAKNGFVALAVPRMQKYKPVQSDFGRYKEVSE